jgi:hypothetical protein
MRQRQFASIRGASLAIGLLGLAAVGCPAQTKSSAQQPEKSSDPAIRWQFDTHG